MRVRDLKGVAMFLFEPMIVPFGERQKPRARPAGVLGQQNDRKASPFPGITLKKPPKRVVFLQSRAHKLFCIWIYFYLLSFSSYLLINKKPNRSN